MITSFLTACGHLSIFSPWALALGGRGLVGHTSQHPRERARSLSPPTILQHDQTSHISRCSTTAICGRATTCGSAQFLEADDFPLSHNMAVLYAMLTEPSHKVLPTGGQPSASLTQDLPSPSLSPDSHTSNSVFTTSPRFTNSPSTTYSTSSPEQICNQCEKEFRLSSELR